MNKVAYLLVVVACVGCSKNKGADSIAVANTAADDGKTCPMPGANDIYAPRFAVGSIPEYAVPDMASDHGHLCTEEFAPSDVLTMQNGKPMLVAAGSFTGTCKEAPTVRTYLSVNAASIGIEVDGLATNEGELGMNKPVVLDSKSPDRMAAIAALPLDRCGDKLSTGSGGGPTTWTLDEGCDKVAKLVPWTLNGPANPTDAGMQVAAVAPGTCTIHAAMLNAKGELHVTVK